VRVPHSQVLAVPCERVTVREEGFLFNSLQCPRPPLPLEGMQPSGVTKVLIQRSQLSDLQTSDLGASSPLACLGSPESSWAARPDAGTPGAFLP
jgi:hypothetical protein